MARDYAYLDSDTRCSEKEIADALQIVRPRSATADLSIAS